MFAGVLNRTLVKRQNEQFGNPRRELLKAIRNQSSPEIVSTLSDGVRRVAILSGQLVESAEQMQQQREVITLEKAKRQRQRGQAQRLARDTGLDLPVTGIERLTSDQVSKLRNLMNEDEIL
jgi:hypothetical protein